MANLDELLKNFDTAVTEDLAYKDEVERKTTGLISREKLFRDGRAFYEKHVKSIETMKALNRLFCGIVEKFKFPKTLVGDARTSFCREHGLPVEIYAALVEVVERRSTWKRAEVEGIKGKKEETVLIMPIFSAYFYWRNDPNPNSLRDKAVATASKELETKIYATNYTSQLNLYGTCPFDYAVSNTALHPRNVKIVNAFKTIVFRAEKDAVFGGRTYKGPWTEDNYNEVFVLGKGRAPGNA